MSLHLMLFLCYTLCFNSVYRAGPLAAGMHARLELDIKANLVIKWLLKIILK